MEIYDRDEQYLILLLGLILLFFIYVYIESLSRDVAQCNAVVLKVNESFRYLFVPKLIDNSKDKSKCISGQFIVQKKSKNDTWDNYNTLPLNKLALGQRINLDLSTSSMETLLIKYIIKISIQL